MKNSLKLAALFFAAFALVAATFHDIMKINVINERTAATGVTVDSVLLKDGTITMTNTDGGLTSYVDTCVTETTDSGAGTETITGVIPAGAVLQSLSCRVDTVIAGAGASTFSLGDGTDADLYGTALAFAAGTTVDTSDFTASPATQAWSASAGDLTMTANAGQFDSGAITCCSKSITSTAPTS